MTYLTEKESFVRKIDPARTFRDLIVWRESHEFVLCVYGFTRIFRKTSGLD